MPKLPEDVPEKLRPYLFHGLQLYWKPSSKDAMGDCPFCSREGKFSVELTTGKFVCPVCRVGNNQGGGNILVFLRTLWEQSKESPNQAAFDELRLDRKLLYTQSLEAWGLVQSLVNGEWVVPGWSPDGRLITLYPYRQVWNNGVMRMALKATSTLGHGLLGRNLFDPGKPVVYLCEGLWDAIALWEVLGSTKLVDGKFSPTGNRGVSLLAGASVLGIAGNNSFLEPWCELFAGKQVRLMTQNDHPKVHPRTNQLIDPASQAGMDRIGSMLLGSKTPPSGIEVIKWGELLEGCKFPYAKDLPSGYDVRDALAV